MLKIKDIEKKFGNIDVLRKVNIDVNNGEIVGVLGPNGAGKTTLLKIISGTIIQDSGSILLDDEKLTVKDFNVAFSSQRGMYWRLTVKENLYYFSALKGVFKNEVDKYLADFDGVDSILNKPFKELSLGQKQIATVIGAIITKPKLLCLDEPSNGLDIKNIETINTLISNYCKGNTNKIIITSHDLIFLYNLVDKFYILNNGEIAKVLINKDITVEEVAEVYRDVVMEDL